MTIHDSFEQQWQDTCDSSSAAGTLRIAAGDGELQCEVAEVNPIACRLNRLSYRSERINHAAPEKLERLGRELCERVSYLNEPLALIELDREATSVQLRSSPPANHEGHIRYFEISIARDRGLQVERFDAAPGEPRKATPASITREVLERLAGDCLEATNKVLK